MMRIKKSDFPRSSNTGKDSLHLTGKVGAHFDRTNGRIPPGDGPVICRIMGPRAEPQSERIPKPDGPVICRIMGPRAEPQGRPFPTSSEPRIFRIMSPRPGGLSDSAVGKLLDSFRNFVKRA